MPEVAKEADATNIVSDCASYDSAGRMFPSPDTDPDSYSSFCHLVYQPRLSRYALLSFSILYSSFQPGMTSVRETRPIDI